jgi:hypothetical protein
MTGTRLSRSGTHPVEQVYSDGSGSTWPKGSRGAGGGDGGGGDGEGGGGRGGGGDGDGGGGEGGGEGGGKPCCEGGGAAAGIRCCVSTIRRKREAAAVSEGGRGTDRAACVTRAPGRCPHAETSRGCVPWETGRAWGSRWWAIEWERGWVVKALAAPQ